MTPQQAKALLENGVLQAFAEGKTIQCLSPTITDYQNWHGTPDETWKWVDLKKAGFDLPATRYRVKPEKKTGWIVVFTNSAGDWVGQNGLIFKTKEFAQDAAKGFVSSRNKVTIAEITYEEGEGL